MCLLNNLYARAEGEVQLQAGGLRNVLDQHRREEREGLPGEGAGVSTHREDQGMKTYQTPRWTRWLRGIGPTSCRRK